MSQAIAPSLLVQQKLAKLATLLEEAGQLARELSNPTVTFAPVAGRKRPANVPEDQLWFWTDEWQAGEREVDEALTRGEYKEFNSMEDAIAHLHKGV